MNCKGTEAENHSKTKAWMAWSFWRHKKRTLGLKTADRFHRQRNKPACVPALRINRRRNCSCGRECRKGRKMCIYFKNNPELTYKEKEHIFPAVLGGITTLSKGLVSDQDNSLFL